MANLLARVGKDFKAVYTTLTGGNAALSGYVPQLGAAGTLDASLIDPSALPQALTLPASQAIPAGRQVNIFSNSGTESVRLADATLGYRADGFVTAAVASGASAKVVALGGQNSALSGLTADTDYYLGASGQPVATQNATAGQLDQYLGKAISATVLNQPPPQLAITN